MMSNFLNNDGSGLVGGLLPSAIGQALQLDANGNLKTSSESNIEVWSRLGNAFAVSSNLITGANANYYQMSIFNPVGSGKTILVYRLNGQTNAATYWGIVQSTADPAYTTNLNGSIVNGKGGGPTSIANVTMTPGSTNAGLPSGALYNFTAFASLSDANLLTNGVVIVLPAGYGVQLSLYNANAGNKFSFNGAWVEF